MTHLMELVAGDAEAILLAIREKDFGAFDDPRQFTAHVALGGGLDPTWLDLFAEAARSVVVDGPADFLDARIELDGGSDNDAGSVERVDPSWVEAVARIPDGRIGAVASRWVDLLEEELGMLAREEKPWIRELTGQLVAFCRAADLTAEGHRAPDVLFAWSLR